MRFLIALVLALLVLFWDLRVQAQFCLPLSELRLTSGFGFRRHPVTGRDDFHLGIDLSARSEPVYSVFAGRVLSCGHHPFLGNFVRVGDGGLIITYGHLSSILVVFGEEVISGEVLGITGATGRVTAEHLHLSIQYLGVYLHPLRFLSGIGAGQ